MRRWILYVIAPALQRTLLAAAFVSAATCVASVSTYNSLAPHTNTENTDFWDTRNYDVEPESSASGVCSTAINRCVTTVDASSAVTPFRRIHRIGTVLHLR